MKYSRRPPWMPEALPLLDRERCTDEVHYGSPHQRRCNCRDGIKIRSAKECVMPCGPGCDIESVVGECRYRLSL